MDATSFFQVFEEILAPDTQRVKAATNALRIDYYPRPESLSLLLQLVISDQPSSLRKLASTQARTLVSKHWRSFADEHQKEFRQRLLQKMLSDEEKLTRHATAQVVTAIAKLDFEDAEWTDLIELLLKAAKHSDPQAREASTFLLSTLLESFGSEIREKFAAILALYSKTINDPESPDVRVNTMIGISRIAILIGADEDEELLQTVHDAVPHMVAVLKHAVDSQDEDRTSQIFEVFQTLLPCESSIVGKHLGNLVHFMMNLAAEKSLSEEARTQAISFLMQCIRFRKLRIQALKIGEELTLKSLEIATELGDSDADDEDITPPRSALGLLDLLASSLPPSQVAVPLLHALGPYVNNSNPDKRQGGIMALSMCIEGAPDFFATQLLEILPLILRLLEDPVMKVRRAALDAAMRLAEDLGSELGKEHGRLIPALVKGLDVAMKNLAGPDDKANMDMVRASCSALDSLVDNLDSEAINPYLPELIPRLGRLISHPNIRIKSSAISALGSLAVSAEKAFLPYFEQAMNSLSEYVRMKGGDEELDLRCTTCDSMGNMALAVGAKPFQRYVRPLMEATEEALNLDHPKLKETSYLFWGTMAKVYESDFKPFLDGVLKGLLDSIEAEESEETHVEIDLDEENGDLAGKEVRLGGKKIKVADLKDMDDAELDDLIEADGADDDDDDDWSDLNAFTALAQEKEIALEVVGDIITHSAQDYLPYLERTIEVVVPLVQHNFEGVRRAAIGTLFRAYAALWGLQTDEVKKWQPGLPLNPRPPSELEKLGDIVMSTTATAWPEEEDSGTVTDVNRNLAATIRLTGPALVSDSKTIKFVTETLVSIFDKKHVCQLDLGYSDDSTDFNFLAETSEYDWLIIDSALDVVVSLATALGEKFEQLWKVFEKPVIRISSGDSSSERSTTVGIIAECIRGMKSAVTPFTTQLLKVLIHRMSDEDADTKSNAAFAVGLLVEHSTDVQEITKSYNLILSKLEPLLQLADARAKDNAAGCVSRMILKHKSRVPLEAVLPALVEILPLREDFEENIPVYDMIVNLYSTSDPAVIALTPQILPVIAQVMAPSPEGQLEPETRAKLVQLVQFVHGKQPALVNGYKTLKEVVGA